MKTINFNHLRDQTIGIVETVSAQRIEILLETDAPQSTALNTGIPTSFPRINSYVLIPNEAGAVVGIVIWLGTKQAQYPKRKGYKDFDLVDLPFPLRQMHVRPVGTLKKEDEGYLFHRGVYTFPSIADIVILPTIKQLASIIENTDEKAAVHIGYAPLAGDAKIYIDPDKLFGRHCAILGNTGSGKSCTVAGLIRWSLEAAVAQKNQEKGHVNARFIVIDPNGEYGNAFSDIWKGNIVRKFAVKVDESAPDFAQLKIPSWMWNTQEWTSIAQASPGVQQPLLRSALRDIRSKADIFDPLQALVNFLASLLANLKSVRNNSPMSYITTAGKQELGGLLKTTSGWLENKTAELKIQLGVLSALQKVVEDHPPDRGGYFPPYDAVAVEALIPLIEEDFKNLDVKPKTSLVSEDIPTPFRYEEFLAFLDYYGTTRDAQQFINYLTNRIKILLGDVRASSVIGTGDDLTLVEWLNTYIGESNGENGEISIIDMSLVPTDLIHIVTAVFARLVFEVQQRYRRKYDSMLPTTLVLEEAHNFLGRYAINAPQTPATLCTQTFERIAKEGRKFGLGLIISSQRPSELSATILSQCNTFILHRLVNQEDQLSVKSLLPDNLGELLEELPVLPTQSAFVMGWAFPLPILAHIKSLKKENQPKSADPDFWKVWIGEEERPIDWKDIVDTWYKEGGYMLPLDEGELDDAA